MKATYRKVALLPFPVIAAAVNGDPDAVVRVVRHYSGYMAVLSMRLSCGSLGSFQFQLDYDLYQRLESKLVAAIFQFHLD